jgi:hypothetical protein
VSVARGPTPGGVLATTAGTVIDLSGLTRPGLAWVMNLDPTNFVTLGLWDGAEFRPLMEFKPGEFFPCRLSRSLGVSFQATGTGTDADVIELMVKANAADCEVIVNIFED